MLRFAAVLLMATSSAAIGQSRIQLPPEVERRMTAARVTFVECTIQTARTLATSSSEDASILADVAMYRCGKAAGFPMGSDVKAEARLAALDAIVTAKAR